MAPYLERPISATSAQNSEKCLMSLFQVTVYTADWQQLRHHDKIIKLV